MEPSLGTMFCLSAMVSQRGYSIRQSLGAVQTVPASGDNTDRHDPVQSSDKQGGERMMITLYRYFDVLSRNISLLLKAKN